MGKFAPFLGVVDIDKTKSFSLKFLSGYGKPFIDKITESV